MGLKVLLVTIRKQSCLCWAGRIEQRLSLRGRHIVKRHPEKSPQCLLYQSQGFPV